MKIAIIGKLYAPISVTSNMGMETFTYHLAHLLAKRGHEVTLFASGDSRVEGVQLIPVVKKSYWGVSQKKFELKDAVGKGYGCGAGEKNGYLKALFYLRSHLDEFDIIHDNTDEMNVLGLSHLLINLPIVSTIHLPPKFLTNLNKMVNKEKLPNYYVAISNKQKKMVKQAKVFSVVYNGINPRKFTFSDKSHGYLSWIGRLDPNKGLGAAIDVAVKTNSKLRIAGPIQNQKYFDEQIKPKLNKNIKYYGPLSGRRLVNFYKGSKALLFPIRWEEPFGLVMAEAMACGTPVIAFRRGAVPEIVVQGKTGYICPKDKISTMVKAVNKINNMSSSRYKKMRLDCRKHVEENFTLEKMVENYEKTYQRVIEDWKAKNAKLLPKMKVLEVTPEFAPIVKAGGLGDVAGSLPVAMVKKFDIDYKVIMPKYSIIDTKKYPLTLVEKKVEFKLSERLTQIVDIYKTTLENNKVTIYLIDAPDIFSKDRVYPAVEKGKNENYPFFILSKIALQYVKKLNWKPDIVHCHDGMTGLVSNLLKYYQKKDQFYNSTASVLTIHNIMYQPTLSQNEANELNLDFNDFKSKDYIKDNKINLMAESIINFDIINTVSPNYAREVLTKEYGEGMDKLLRQNNNKFQGILNGINYKNFDPRTNEDTPTKYWIDSIDKKIENKLFVQKKLGLTQSPDLPLICVVSRLTKQKGSDLIEDVLKDLVDMGAQFVVLGMGTSDFNVEKLFIKAEKENPKEIATHVFDTHFAQTMYAGADMLLVPSRFEPCGLSQIIAMRFGTIPIVRKTGGLADTVIDGKTGFVFKHYDKNAFLWAIRRAVDIYYNQKDVWRRMQLRCMRQNFSWDNSAVKYLRLYKKTIELHKEKIKNEE